MSIFSKATPWLIVFALSLTACGKKGADADASSQQPFPYLGTSASYAILAKTDVTNTGASVVYGSIGLSGSNKGQINGLNGIKRTGGEIHTNNAAAAKAVADSESAYNNLKSKGCDHDLTGQNLGGMTLTPGAYCFSGDAHLDGLLRLDFKGDKHANFVFKVGGDLMTAPDSGIIVLNNGESCNVYWQVPGSVTIGSKSNLVGGFHAVGNINVNYKSMLNGKLSSQQGAVTIDSSEIYNNFCPWWK
jgi:hypothetical protein